MRESLRRLASEERERGMGARRRVRVELLDGDHVSIALDRKAKGSELLDRVCESLDVVERDYFGLVHQQRGDPRVWLDLNRRLSKTFRNEPWDVRFAVKFYPPEPSSLRDDVTRYQLSLAVRRDLLEGRLTCSAITYALLASYVLQAELGDYEGHLRPTALTEHRAAPLGAINPDLEAKVVELYRKHKGQTPAEAELHYLENAARLALYGAALHCARDSRDVDIVLAVCAHGISVYRDGGQTPAEAELHYLENAARLALYGAALHCARDSRDVDIVLAVCAHGISVYRDGILMNRFPWAKISKISYNKRSFVVGLRPGECDDCATQLAFRLPSTRACKKLWRCSVEHHIFFRRETPVKVERISGFPRLGSRRVSCRRTLQQLRAAPSPRAITA